MEAVEQSVLLAAYPLLVYLVVRFGLQNTPPSLRTFIPPAMVQTLLLYLGLKSLIREDILVESTPLRFAVLISGITLLGCLGIF
jgi:hypothetical protein